jgi:hypothetical protein
LQLESRISPLSIGSIPNPERFYAFRTVPPCYGLKADEDSVAAAISAKDPCKVVLTAKGCAPGWTVELLPNDRFCSAFEACKEKLPKLLKA